MSTPSRAGKWSAWRSTRPVPVLEFIARFKLELVVALAGVDGTRAGSARWATRSGGLPFTVVLDAKGRVRQRKLGESRYDELVRLGF